MIGGFIGTALITLNRINFGSKNCSYIPLSDFTGASYTGKVLIFTKRSDQQIIWSGHYGNIISVTGLHSLVFGTSLIEGSAKICTYVDEQNLKEAINVLKATYENLTTTEKIPKIDTPYSRELLENFLISSKIKSKSEYKCKICKKSLLLSKMRQHVAKHFLRHQTVQNSCGYCGLSCDSILEIRKSSGYGLDANFKPFFKLCLFLSFQFSVCGKDFERIAM